MPVTDIATRVYKLLMLQMIRHLHPDVQATFSLINRSKSVRLADVIDETERREQLDHARTARFSRKELIWLGERSATDVQSTHFARVLIGARLGCRVPSERLSDAE